jgi:predicted DNA-binding antitoxin AbrB/MazE fold protein
MSEQVIKAVYQDGAFHPTESLALHYREGQEVEIAVKETPEDQVERILALLDHFYDGLSEEEIDKIEKAMRRRPNFFGDDEAEEVPVDPNRPA